MAKRKFKVWVTMSPKRPAPFSKFFLNANPRILTVWRGRANPNVKNTVRATLTIEDAKP